MKDIKIEAKTISSTSSFASGSTKAVNLDVDGAVSASAGSSGADAGGAGGGRIENLSKTQNIQKSAKSKKSDFTKTKIIKWLHRNGLFLHPKLSDLEV